MPARAPGTILVEIARYSPERDAEPGIERFELPPETAAGRIMIEFA
ncbi:MAG: hypothetical protein ACRD2Y_12545 [Terriglobales bacterium]